MAGDWIKMRIDLATHPKAVRIMSATKSDRFRVIGGLHSVWGVFDQHTEDGELHGYTPELMDTIIGWEGFSDAMIKVGWMHYDGDETLVMPGFDSHNGKSARRRAEDSHRKRVSRSSDQCPQTVRKLSDENADVVETREEKSRVLHNTSKKTCPYQAILSVFHETLPELPSVIKLTETRKKKLAARWFGSKHSQTIEWWRDYFFMVKRSPFLMGSTGSFRTTFDWLIEERNFIKVLEGNYV